MHSMKIEKQEFQKMWSEIVNILHELGETNDDYIEKLKIQGKIN